MKKYGGKMEEYKKQCLEEEEYRKKFNEELT